MSSKTVCKARVKRNSHTAGFKQAPVQLYENTEAQQNASHPRKNDSDRSFLPLQHTPKACTLSPRSLGLHRCCRGAWHGRTRRKGADDAALIFGANNGGATTIRKCCISVAADEPCASSLILIHPSPCAHLACATRRQRGLQCSLSLHNSNDALERKRHHREVSREENAQRWRRAAPIHFPTVSLDPPPPLVPSFPPRTATTLYATVSTTCSTACPLRTARATQTKGSASTATTWWPVFTSSGDCFKRLCLPCRSALLLVLLACVGGGRRAHILAPSLPPSLRQSRGRDV